MGEESFSTFTENLATHRKFRVGLAVFVSVIIFLPELSVHSCPLFRQALEILRSMKV
jgi:hypothetical protein